ncbi:MAG: D-glycero-beta-D-manno-heptose 1-phosphate adenylyltransferase [candidate division Zixibacteria bacterium HGW-Zixibacteria-1]|nr:MAG: D-glycero-beta-D-manno-heptose 1-phosphate adenylyltransferase [candidate division Zixibacteria bacterium HGW-Zixibacteria-1]
MSKKIFKTASSPDTKKLIKNLRRSKKKIVFTNGVFDIMHFGHIDYLRKAKALGDILIVGLNTDSSVKKFKSKERPVQNQSDRAAILTALEAVDYVIMFSEETPEKLIQMVRPDVLVKGADYKISEIVGAAFVKSYGGKVKRIKLARGRSTTAIIKKIKQMKNI